MQMTMFDGQERFYITLPIRLISFFSGYESQLFSLKYLCADVKSWRTCEWAVKSIQALKDAHFGDDNTDYSQGMTDLEVYEYLFNHGISANYNEPMTFEQIKRLGGVKARTIFNNIIATHNLVNIQQVHGEDLGIVDVDKYCYIMTYSFPCQDLSLAGKGAGMEKGSGTRSGMLWEVERILDEIVVEGGQLPQVLLMENVPEVVGSKNMPNFVQWRDKLEKIGYKCYWKVLNAKDYGVPQNRERCFMVSILGDYYYEFPQAIPLEHRLKDLLEDEVDEKYYLSDKMIKYISQTGTTNYNCGGAEINLPVARALTASMNKMHRAGIDNYVGDGLPSNYNLCEPKVLCGIGEKKSNGGTQWYQQDRVYDDNIAISVTTSFNPYYAVKQVGQIYGFGKEKNPQAGRIYDSNGLSPTLDTCTCGNRMPKIIEQMTEPRICASRGRNPNNPSSRKSGEHLEQRIELGPEGVSNTLTTVQKDNYVIEPTNLKRELCNNLISNGIVQEGDDIVRHSYTKSRFDNFHIENSKNHDCCATLPTRADTLGVVKDYRIRKLTPKECFRLMGVKDEDFEKIAKNQSNASLYHLAGDSIVVDVLMAIFMKMLKEK